MTLADLRLFTTAIRFDGVYLVTLKVQKNTVSYICGIPELVGMAQSYVSGRMHIRAGGFSHTIKQALLCDAAMVNPAGVVPVGPNIEFTWHRTNAIECSPS